MSGAFHVVIPARYASTRLPGKMLKDLRGRPMIQHVVERALASGASSVHVATDDGRIRDALRDAGCDVVMTSSEHGSGTERLAEACQRIGFAGDAVVVNVQGDEPLIPAALIRQSAELLLRHPEAAIATLCHRIESLETLLDPNVVKVVFDVNGRALWFTRSPVPFERQGFDTGFGSQGHACHWRHIGIYAYTADAIADYVALAPCAAERSEALEQLRALHHGRIVMIEDAVERPGPGIDTEADLQRVRELMAGAGGGGAGQIQ